MTRPDGIRMWVFRAWDKEWVAECSACGEVHWSGGWMDAMVSAWGHLAMRHPLPPQRIVIPDSRAGLIKWDPSWFVWTTNGCTS